MNQRLTYQYFWMFAKGVSLFLLSRICIIVRPIQTIFSCSACCEFCMKRTACFVTVCGYHFISIKCRKARGINTG